MTEYQWLIATVQALSEWVRQIYEFMAHVAAEFQTNVQAFAEAVHRCYRIINPVAYHRSVYSRRLLAVSHRNLLIRRRP